MAIDGDALFDLLSWSSPAWPIGAFAHSGGLEWAVEEGHVHDRVSCRAWLTDLVEAGPVQAEAVFFVHAWRAAWDRHEQAFEEVAALALAAQSGAERRLETCAQGEAFRRIALSAAPHDAFARLAGLVPEGELAYPVAAACLYAARGIELDLALVSYLHGSIANFVSAAQRLVPLGQTEAQQVLAQLRPAVVALARDTIADPSADPFDALQGCSLVAEIGCMAHEIQYTRLFRT